MKKFVCAHCGHRLAVAPRHYGKLVHCPECGKVTHPLAEQILQAAAPASTTAKDPEPATIPCANCGHPIGKLQKRHTWKKRVVCTDCHTTLTRESTPAASRAESPHNVSAIVLPRESVVPREAAVDAKEASLIVAAGRMLLPAVTRQAKARVSPAVWKYRAMFFLGGALLAGAALYGLLTLLRDLTGVFTSFAAILLGLGVVYLLVRFFWAAGKRAVARRLSGQKS